MPIAYLRRKLRAKFSQLSAVSFVRSVTVLVGGTAFAQALTMLALPLITRLYTPEDFTVLAVYASISVILTVVACLRFEIAIPLPQKDSDAVNLVVLALISCTGFALIAGILTAIFYEEILILIGQPALRPFLWTLVPATWLASCYVTLTFWATRQKKFFVVAKTRVTQAISGVSVQILFGLVPGLGPLGLILGQIISSGAGVFNLGKAALGKSKEPVKEVSRHSLVSVLLQYQRFPKYSTFDALASSAAIQLPVLMIAALAIGPDAGYLLLATRAMAAPLGLVGSAVSQVYLSQAPSEARSGRLSGFTSGVIGGLAKTGVGPLVFFGVIASWLFPLIFGSKWARAGELVAWMTPWFVMQFLSNPISMVMQITNSLRIALILQISGLLIRVGSVFIASIYAVDYLVESYAISSFLFYTLHFCVVLKLSEIKANQLKTIMKSSFPVVLTWLLTGFFMTAIFWGAEKYYL